MENMQFAEEFLVFRGFTKTLQAFESELCTDIGKGFQVDKLLNLIFSVYIPRFEAMNLVGLQQLFSSSTETVLFATLSKLEISILRCYIVHATRSGRKDKVVEFFAMNGNDLLMKGEDWSQWFAMPYVKNPSTDPQFRAYFSKEWYEALHLSFLQRGVQWISWIPIPIIKISSEKDTVSRLRKETKELNIKLAQLQALTEVKEAQLSQSRRDNQETGISATSHLADAELAQDWTEAGKAKEMTELSASKSIPESESGSLNYEGDNRNGDSIHMLQDGNGRGISVEEFPEVKVDFQDTFLGHTSPITRCRFSASGNNIACASVDGTVRYLSGACRTKAKSSGPLVLPDLMIVRV